MEIQWYPGHMTKTRRMLEEDIRLCDLIIELTDARAPASGRNPDIAKLAASKSRVLLLTKADLADESVTAGFLRYFEAQGHPTRVIDARKTKEMKGLLPLFEQACAEKFERERKRGMKRRPIRAMVVGIPNVGKSSFINAISGKASAKTGNRPGVTRGKQWIRMNAQLELLDTPGLLWPKFEDETVALRLALIGTINDRILPQEELAHRLIRYLRDAYPGLLAKRFETEEEGNAEELLLRIGERRAVLGSGGAVDTERAAALVLDDFRSGKIGRISLERASDE